MRFDEVPTRAPDHEETSAAVTAAFSLLPYPISKDMAIEALGSWQVPVGERRVPLGRLLDPLPEDGFEDPIEVARAVDRHWGALMERLDE